MSFKDDYHAAMKKLLVKSYGLNVAEVTSIEEDTFETGGCETCWDSWPITVVTYRSPAGEEIRHVLDESLGSVIRELIEHW